MLRAAGIRCARGIRLHSSIPRREFLDVDIDIECRSTSQQSFGEVVGENANDRVIDRDQLLSHPVSSPYRHESGSLIHGKNAHEARLLPETLQARTYRDQLELNPIVSQAIKNNILSLHLPNNIRRSAANYFVEMYREKLHSPARTEMEVDSHIAAIFVQNYGSIFQSLAELKKRVGPSFQPKRILDVGYGPATGIVALNELMDKNFNPELREAVILSGVEMQKRAKIILSRYLSEIPNKDSALEEATEELQDDIAEDKELVGEVMTKKININTKLRNSVPGSSNYDLIILTHQLLKNEERFPMQIDDNVEHYLKLLAPGGYIVIVERGNPLGFEIISRARQIMIRPENYPEEHGKIPRPYMRGSSIKRRPTTEGNDGELEEDAQKLMQEISSRHGEVQAEDMEFEPELLQEMSEENVEEHPNYHLKIIAPCPHHRKCPLQIGNPKYYEYDEGKKLKFCNFQKSIMRPKFNIELKKGKILATRWQEPTDGVGIEGLAKPGTGRPNGRNYEILNYSYLIAQRSQTDSETVSQIDKQREESRAYYDIGSLGDGTQETWPRIINQPIKRKGHVTMDLCGSSGQLEKWVIPKSFDKEIYHDARKAVKGDLWGLDAKTKIKGAANLNVDKFEKLEKERIKKSKTIMKKQDREIAEKYNDIKHDAKGLLEEEVDGLAEVYGYDYTRGSQRKQKLYNKRKFGGSDH